MFFELFSLIFKEPYFIFCLIKVFVFLKGFVFELVFKKLDESWNVVICAQWNGLDKLCHISLMVFVVLQQILLFHGAESVGFLELINVFFGDFFEHAPEVVVGRLETFFIEFLCISDEAWDNKRHYQFNRILFFFLDQPKCHRLIWTCEIFI